MVRAAAIFAAGALLVSTPRAVLSQVNTSTTNIQSPTNAGQGARSGQGSNMETPMVTVPEDFATLKLGPGFLLNISVYGEPDLSGQVRVDDEGNISIPFLNQIHVGGGTIAEARDKIQQKFRDRAILKNPQVSVNVEQFPTSGVTVVGEVQSPGRVELLSPHSLLDVIGLTGGETAQAGDEIELKRANAPSGTATSTVYKYSRGSNGDSIRDVMVHPGDTVIVKRAGIVYVLGAVNRPGGYPMQEDGKLNVAQAISMAMGLGMQARTSGLRVVKHGEDGKLIDVPVSYNRMMNGKEAPMELEAGDIVYVPVSKVKAVFNTSSSLIGQTASATIYTMH
jgi:polysaccharide export outer membrane protein